MALALIAVMRGHRLQRGADTVLDPRRYGARPRSSPVWARRSPNWRSSTGRRVRDTPAAGSGTSARRHSIVLNLSSIAYMVPLGISLVAATRVGNLIGAGDREGAASAGCRWVWGRRYGRLRGRVRARRHAIPGPRAMRRSAAAAMLPIAAAFELFDGVQCVGGGSWRMAARVLRRCSISSATTCWRCLAGWLGTADRFGLEGIWWVSPLPG